MRGAAACALLVALAACRRAPEPAPLPPPSPVARQAVMLSGPWRFLESDTVEGGEAPDLDDTAWPAVQVPHTWGAQARRRAWYRLRLDWPPADEGKRAYAHFEGVAVNAEVFLNGAFVGRHRGAFTRFLVDLTPHLRAGANLLAVRVTNHPDDTAGSLPSGKGKQLYHLYGGIYRKAWLLKTHAWHVDPTQDAAAGVFLTPENVSARGADLGVRTLVRNATAGPGAAELVQTLADPDGRVVRSWQATLSLGAGERGQLARRVRVERPALWGPGRPSLYRLRTEVRVGGRLVDVVEERTGFRDFRLEGGRFLLNGQPIALRGVGKHQETEHRLSAVADEDLREDFARLVDLGVNSVRLAHYPHAPLAYDLADEAGLLVWAENGHSNPHRPGEEGEQITREMVRQNYNHPSIVMWSVGNESAFLRVNRLAAVVKQEDPGRLVTYASNTGTRGKKRHPDLDFIAQNTYRGWYRGEAWEFEERAVSMRFVSESGGGAVVSHHTDYADARHVVDAFEPEEYRQLLAEVHFQVVFRDRAAEVPLYLVWILRDFATDKYKGRNTKGLLTYANLEKDAYHLYRSFLRPEVPVVHLTSQTRFVRRGRADNGIKAYANRPVLELLVNGRSQGLRRNGEHRHGNGRVVENVFHWPATLAPGRNEVRVRDGAGHEDAAVVYQLEPGQTHSPSGPEALLTDLRSSNPRNPAVLVETPARDQWPFYAEFDGTADNSFDRLPLRVQGARWIATSRPSKPGLETELRFRVGRRPLEVFVMAAAGGPLPRAWARDGFQDTGEQGLFRDNDLKLVPVRLLARRAREGEVVRLAAAGRLDYVVLVKEGTGLEGRAAAEDTGRP